MSFLPDDIVYYLCGWLDTPTLTVMNRVSRDFYAAAVGFVWAHLTLSYNGQTWNRFEGTVAMLSVSPHLTKVIGSLRIQIWESSIPSESETDTLHRVLSAIRVLQLSTRLRKLQLYLNRERPFGRLFYEELARGNFNFKLEECAIPGSFAPPREFMHFLQPMTSLRSLTMSGIRDQEYGWLNYKPDPDNWPFLESIHFGDIQSVAAFIPGRPIQKVTVWELSSDSPKLRSLVKDPVESMRTFKMLSWESEHSPRGAKALEECLSDLRMAFPRISTLFIGYWYAPADDDGPEHLPPMFTKATFRTLGEFKELQTLVCPIWATEGEREDKIYHAEPLLSDLHVHCPSLHEVFLREGIFTPPAGPELYENWVRIISDCSMESMWEKKEWNSPEALAKHVDSL